MDYHLHNNGWTVMVDNFDIKQATHTDILEISKLLSKHTLIVFRGQQLSTAEELRVINMFKDPETFESTDEHSTLSRCIVPDTENKILRVTGELNDQGHPGFFGHVTELNWHCNSPSNPNGKPLVWLRSVHGSKGSRTVWNNNVESYKDLPEAKKEFLKTLNGVFGYDHDRFTATPYRPENFINTEYTPPIVHTNRAGVTGLLFPFLQLFYFTGMTEEESRKIIEPLAEYTTQDRYCYFHDWEDGDIVIADQFFGIHKRLEFEGMATRLLHRITFDYPDQDYEV